MHETIPGPSYSGSVVLDLGPGQGALVLHTPPELDGEEIEISPCGPDPAGPHGHRTHSQVRRRDVASGSVYAAVYPGLAEGEYVLWRDPDTTAMSVTIAGGTVTTATWPD